MTTSTSEPAPPVRRVLPPFVLLCAAIYLFFTALAMEVYALVPVAAACAALGAAPAVRLLRRR
jgi:hypothetical protein